MNSLKEKFFLNPTRHLVNLLVPFASIFSHYEPPTSNQLSNCTILHHGHTPTLDFYWTGRFSNNNYVDTQKNNPSRYLLSKGRNLVIVRHIPRQWLTFIKRNQKAWPAITYFFDDDILGILDDPTLPPAYALRTFFKFRLNLGLLKNICSHVLVSTPALAKKYGLQHSCVLDPEYVSSNTDRAGTTVFYHGTESHRREIIWLRRVVEMVQTKSRDCIFELSGPAWVRDLYSDIPRVRVIHPMNWKSFFEYTSAVKFDIGLSPVLDTPYNRFRSHVKLLDITRTGAAGIYSKVPQFEMFVKHGYNGLLLDNDPRLWAREILDMSARPDLRKQLFNNALNSVKKP